MLVRVRSIALAFVLALATGCMRSVTPAIPPSAPAVFPITVSPVMLGQHLMIALVGNAPRKFTVIGTVPPGMVVEYRFGSIWLDGAPRAVGEYKFSVSW